MYPLTYSEMCNRFKNKYQLKINKKFTDAKKILEEEEICCKARYLDPDKKGTSRTYYNSNFIDNIYLQIKK